MINVREGIIKAYEYLSQGYIPLLIAPTSYSKTIGSLYILEKARREGLAPKLIHIVPLKALVREIYSEKFKNTPFATGYQMHDKISEEDKSPYLLRELVVTTLDSYIWNILRIPVAEYVRVIEGHSRGHYYPVLASIYSAVNVFDEAHLYIGDTSRAGILGYILAIIENLFEHKIPFIIETATLHTSLVERISNLDGGVVRKKLVAIYESCGTNTQIRNLKDRGIQVSTTCDENFNEKYNGIRWRTRIIDENEALKKAVELCSRGFSVLFIRNTIAKAIKTYEQLRTKCNNVLLLHSLIGVRDREVIINNFKKQIKNKKGSILVSTQIVEHGVELETDAIITDIAPIENITQRIGRLCRSEDKLRECKKDDVPVYIISLQRENISADKNIYDVYLFDRVINTLYEIVNILSKYGSNGIEWRLLSNSKDKISFTEIMEKTKPPIIDNEFYGLLRNYTRKYLKSEAPQSTIMSISRELSTELATNYMVKLALLDMTNNIVETLKTMY